MKTVIATKDFDGGLTMDKTTAIAELSALLKHHSDGYYLYLANGGKNDPDVEIELAALDFAIRYLQDPESLRPKGRWTENRRVGFSDAIEDDVCWFTYTCSECGGEVMNDYHYCPNCGAKMEG